VLGEEMSCHSPQEVGTCGPGITRLCEYRRFSQGQQGFQDPADVLVSHDSQYKVDFSVRKTVLKSFPKGLGAMDVVGPVQHDHGVLLEHFKPCGPRNTLESLLHRSRIDGDLPLPLQHFQGGKSNAGILNLVGP